MTGSIKGTMSRDSEMTFHYLPPRIQPSDVSRHNTPPFIMGFRVHVDAGIFEEYQTFTVCSVDDAVF